MGIQYWPGMKQNPDSQKAAMDDLAKTLNTEVILIPMNEYIQSGISALEVLKRVKSDCQTAIDNGFNNAVAFSSGASLFIASSKDVKVENAVLLSPTLTPLNPAQRKKDKLSNEGKPHAKLSSQFTLYDGVLVFGYAFLANLRISNLKGMSTLIIQGTEDEKNRPKGSIKLQNKLLQLDAQDKDLHTLELIEGKHNLLSRGQTKEKSLVLINDFINKKSIY
jgi:hypothetical protein